MKPPESGVGNSRSSTCFEIRNHGKAASKTTGRVRRQRGLLGVAREAEDLRRPPRRRCGETWSAPDRRRIRGGLPLSENVLSPDRLAAVRQEGGIGRCLARSSGDRPQIGGRVMARTVRKSGMNLRPPLEAITKKHDR